MVIFTISNFVIYSKYMIKLIFITTPITVSLRIRLHHVFRALGFLRKLTTIERPKLCLLEINGTLNPDTTAINENDISKHIFENQKY